MAKYKPFYKEDAEAFLRLYKEYLDNQLEEMRLILNGLPTDVIERVFDGTDIHKKEDQLFIEFGYFHIESVAKELIAYDKLHKDKLVEFLANYGHKVNLKKVGVRTK